MWPKPVGMRGCDLRARSRRPLARVPADNYFQTGLMNLIKGLFGAFRNTTAHAPKIHWQITEQAALDILTTISLIHRRLDSAVRTHVP